MMYTTHRPNPQPDLCGLGRVSFCSWWIRNFSTPQGRVGLKKTLQPEPTQSMHSPRLMTALNLIDYLVNNMIQ